MKELDEDKNKDEINEKPKGIKRKNEQQANPKKKENSKKAYKRRVAAYKRKRLKLKGNREILLPTDIV